MKKSTWGNVMLFLLIIGAAIIGIARMENPIMGLLSIIGFGAVIGPRAAVDLALPIGWDAGRLFQFLNMRSKLTGEQIISKTAAAIGKVNEQLVARYGGILFITNTPFGYQRQGGTSGKTPTANEYKTADPVNSGQNIGSMYPLQDYKDAIAWTEPFLRDAYEAMIDGDVAVISDRWYNRVNSDILTRLLTNTENAIGSGWDVPWAIGTGTNVDYIPPQYGGYAFDSTHTHFQAVAGTGHADYALLLNAQVLHLRHHGLQGRLVALVSDADIDTYMAMAKFVDLNPDNIILTAGSSDAPVYSIRGEVLGIPGEIFGYFKSKRGLVELRAHESIPTQYNWVTVSYGVNNPANGLAVREHPDVGFGLTVRPLIKHNPQPVLDIVEFTATHGIAVNNRLNGVAGRVGNASWTNPDLSGI